MDPEGLFTLAAAPPPGAPSGFPVPGPDAPLAVRMRPRTLDELVGQQHLLAPGAPLRQLVTGALAEKVMLRTAAVRVPQLERDIAALDGQEFGRNSVGDRGRAA